MLLLGQFSKPLWLLLLLLLSGDIETNPGPKAPPKEVKAVEKVDPVGTKMDEHDAKLVELETLVKAQAEVIDDMKKFQEQVLKKLEEKQEELKNSIEANKVNGESNLGEMKVSLENQFNMRCSNLEESVNSLKVVFFK